VSALRDIRSSYPLCTGNADRCSCIHRTSGFLVDLPIRSPFGNSGPRTPPRFRPATLDRTSLSFVTKNQPTPTSSLIRFSSAVKSSLARIALTLRYPDAITDSSPNESTGLNQALRKTTQLSSITTVRKHRLTKPRTTPSQNPLRRHIKHTSQRLLHLQEESVTE
jgi:hypothetical protein